MKNQLLKRVVKIAISLVYFGLISLARRSDGRLVILYYHGVPARFRLNFQRQMDALRRRANVIPATFRGRLPAAKQCVAITFDDAFDSLIDNALPILAARSFHSTIFVPVGWIARRPSWATDEDGLGPEDVVMTIEQLRGLDFSLVSLGAHTISHPLLTKLDMGRLREEIEGSR